MVLTFEQIKELIDIVCERRLQAVEIERAGFRLRIDGKGPDQATAGSAAPPAAGQPQAPAVETPPVAAATPAIAAGSEPAAEEDSLPEGAHVMRSPIVGTFYASPSPGADPYAQAGDEVQKGQVLCIVEAMKLMNEIEADIGGEVIEVYPKNAQPVEFGEPLFAIRPA